jgi:uncharacterized membrane protein
MKIAALLVALLAAGPAAATQEYILPTLFDVTGVSPASHLNVRSGPGTGNAVIGSLAPDATGIEVVAHSADGRWGQINLGEGAGWASLTYLAYRTDVWEEGALPAGMRCFGNEPFWSLAPSGDQLVYSTPEGERAFALDAVLSTGIPRHPRRAVSGSDSGGRIVATVVPAACSDGMSDRAFGLDATVVLDEDGAPRMLTGCCSIAP